MTRKAYISVFVCLLLLAGVSSPQTPEQTGKQGPEVLRVFTELVQTDVMVFDRGGHFQKNLKREDFELKIDGKIKPVEFFEVVTAGSLDEESQLAAARGLSIDPRSVANGVRPLDRGRTVFFYIDDVHLDLPGLNETKKVISQFIEKEIDQNDEAAIASTTGQIGFLQQLTDNKTVLRAALSRLKYRPYTVKDMGDVRMSEYQALLIDNNDRDVTDYFVDETIKRNPGLTREAAAMMVNGRARAMLQQGASATTNTLSGLEGLIRTLSTQPGRKLLFFISGGFFLDNRNSDSMERLRRITSAAARSGVVIYSMDARGLVNTMAGSSEESQFDTTGRLLRAAGGELTATQDGMNALAKDTGGKTIFNSNSLGPGLHRALGETATYYLLAWKPDHEGDSNKFRRIEVKVAGRPELNVQVRRGYFDREPEPPTAKTKKKEDKPNANSPEAQLRKVITEAYPNRDIPIALSLHYLDAPSKGMMLSAAMEVPSEFLTFATVDGKGVATVNVAGSFYNDHGQVGAFFNNQIKIEAPPEGTNAPRNLVYNYPVYLKPGLYQVRVGARDSQSGRAGSAHSWIEIPDLGAGQFTLSSLLVGMRDAGAVRNASIGTPELDSVNLSVSGQFSANGYLRFLLFVYNAALSTSDGKPDLALQVQIVREGQPVITAPLKKLPTDGVVDLKRIPYAAEITLAGLVAGRYQLQVSVVDRVSKRSASQQSRFDIR